LIQHETYTITLTFNNITYTCKARKSKTYTFVVRIYDLIFFISSNSCPYFSFLHFQRFLPMR